MENTKNNTPEIDFTNTEIAVLLAEMDQHRDRMGMSYQAVADACDVSQSTIIRALKGQTEASYTLLQKIAASIRYSPPQTMVMPTDCTMEAYNAYLQNLIIKIRDDHERQLLQQEAQFNRLRRQDRRTIFWLCLILALLVSAFIMWLIIDVTHPTVGWFQREVAYNSSFNLRDIYDTVKETLL